MSKRFEKQKRRNGRSFATAEIIELHRPDKFETERALPPIKALTPTQADYLDALRTSPQVIVLGPAGTGKTWIAATYAADLYRKRRIGKIILTRPNVPCGRSLGFFPGSLEEKFAPWAAPIVEAIKERIGQAAYEIAVKKGAIVPGKPNESVLYQILTANLVPFMASKFRPADRAVDRRLAARLVRRV